MTPGMMADMSRKVIAHNIPASHDRITGPIREYAEAWGSKVVENQFLRWFALILTAAVFCLAGLAYNGWSRPIEIVYVRINDIGKAEVVPATEFSQSWHEPELKYFLTLFTQKYFERRRATIQDDLPRAQALMESAYGNMWHQTHRDAVAKLIREPLDTEVEIRNVVLQETQKSPFQAQIAAVSKLVDPQTREVREAKDFIATIDFVKAAAKDIATDMIPFNPMGIAIIKVRKDEVFSTR
jgi:hypothetical protein